MLNREFTVCIQIFKNFPLFHKKNF